MKYIGRVLLPLILLSFSGFALAATWQGNVDKEIGDKLAQTLISTMEANKIHPEKGQAGISVLYLPADNKPPKTFSINGDEPFFMASTYKVAIAAQFLHLVDTGKMSLSHTVTLKPQDMVPGTGVLPEYFAEATISIPALNLLQLMMQESDNTATDSILELAGGPHAVNDRIQALNIKGMRIDRSTLQFFADFLRITLPPEHERSMAYYIKLLEHANPQSPEEFVADPRDNTTPKAMTQLLATIYEQKAMQPESTKLLLEIMSKKNENVGRLYLKLPEDVWVAQKLGTGEGVVNDVGIIKLPNNKGILVIAIYTKNIPSEDAIKNHIPSVLAREIYNHFQ